MRKQHNLRRIEKSILGLILVAMLITFGGCSPNFFSGAQGVSSQVTETPKGTETVQDSVSDQTSKPSNVSDALLSVYFFQAGKADAILIRTSSSAVLIDCGLKGYGKTILNYLKQNNISSIDFLIITHFDKDHVGGAAKVINKISVGRVLQNDCMKDSEECENYLKALNKAGIEAETVTEKLSFELDGVSFTVEPHYLEYTEKTSNNDSLIVSVKAGETDLLFTGDIETARIVDFISDNKETYEFLKIPHHGKEEPLIGELLESVKPVYAVITSSDDDPESEKVMSAIYDAEAEVFLTRVDPVMLNTDGSSIDIHYVDP